MRERFNTHKFGFRAVAIIIIITFSLNDIAYGLDGGSPHESSQTLSPVSRFCPIVNIEERDGEFVIVESPEDGPMIDREKGSFKDDVAFLYLNRLIAQVLDRYSSRISADGLIRLIEKHLSHLEHVDRSNFKWRELYKDGNAFCLPYKGAKAHGGRLLLLRYYLPEDKPVEVAGAMEISAGVGGVKVVCESGEGIRTSDALMVHVSLLKGDASLTEILVKPEGYADTFFKPLYELLFIRLREDFVDSEDFINRCHEIIKREGVLGLRDRMARRDETLVEAFTKIKCNGVTQDASIALYGVLLFFLVSTPEYSAALQDAIQELYDTAQRGGHFPAKDVKTSVERGTHSVGEEVFEAGRRRFTLRDLEENGMPAAPIEDIRRRRAELRQAVSWPIDHLYGEFIKTRPADRLSFARKGISYHIRGHSIVHLYPKGLIYEGDQSIFMESILSRYGETVPRDRTASPNADKIREAIRVWGEVAPNTEDMRQRFVASGSVVELEMDTSLLFSDPEANVVRPLQIGRSRQVFYLSKQYLDNLDIGNRMHMRELAFFLKLGQSFLDKHDAMAESGLDQAERQEALDDFNEHFLALGDSSRLITMDYFRRRLFTLMRSDFLVRCTNGMEEILEEEQELSHINAKLAGPAVNFKTRRTDLGQAFNLTYGLLARYNGAGMDEMADKTYRRMRDAAKARQQQDPAGLLPYDCQVTLVFTAVKFGHWDDYLEELERLLTGRNFPRAVLDEERALVRDLVAPTAAGGLYNLERELRKALYAQMSVMNPDNFERVARRTEELFEEARQIIEEVRPQAVAGRDAFDRLVEKCAIIDLDRTVTRDEALRMVSDLASSVTGMSPQEVFDQFVEREAQASTVVAPGVAIPHIAIDEDRSYEMFLVRSKKGIIFPGETEPVRVMFACVSPRGTAEQASFHLRAMMAIAQIANKPDFMERWLACKDGEALRALLLGSEREREEKETEQAGRAPAAESPQGKPDAPEVICAHEHLKDDSSGAEETLRYINSAGEEIAHIKYALKHRTITIYFLQAMPDYREHEIMTGLFAELIKRNKTSADYVEFSLPEQDAEKTAERGFISRILRSPQPIIERVSAFAHRRHPKFRIVKPRAFRPSARDIKGENARDSNSVARDLLRRHGMVEIEYDGNTLRAWRVKPVAGYSVGVTREEEYRGDAVAIDTLLTRQQQDNLVEWLRHNRLKAPPETGARNLPYVRFRVAPDAIALRWQEDLDHSNIIHAGYHDRCIYIGEHLLEHLLRPEQADLREEILTDDELWHLQDIDNAGHPAGDEAYVRRKEKLEHVVKRLIIRRRSGHDAFRPGLKNANTDAPEVWRRRHEVRTMGAILRSGEMRKAIDLFEFGDRRHWVWSVPGRQPVEPRPDEWRLAFLRHKVIKYLESVAGSKKRSRAAETREKVVERWLTVYDAQHTEVIKRRLDIILDLVSRRGGFERLLREHPRTALYLLTHLQAVDFSTPIPRGGMGVSTAIGANMFGSYITVLAGAFPELAMSRKDIRLVWQEERNSAEENLALGISNVRHRVFRFRPDIYECLLAYQEEPTNAKLWKLRKMLAGISLDDFIIWGASSACVRHEAPYFDGSLEVALTRSFPELGLEPRDLSSKLDWSSEEEAVANVRGKIKVFAPGLYYRCQDAAEKKRADMPVRASSFDNLRRRFLEIRKKDIDGWGLGSVFLEETVPYFNCDLRVVIIKSFPELGLTKEDFGPEWTMPGNAPEEDLELGRRNVRRIFEKQKPGLFKRYTEYCRATESGEDVSEQRQRLEEELVEITAKTLNGWGIYAAGIPYFFTYAQVIVESFPEVGLDVRDFDLVWTRRGNSARQDLALGIDNVRYRLGKYSPALYADYLAFAAKVRARTATSRERKALQERFISIGQGEFEDWGLGAVYNVSYFGSHIAALVKSFPELRLRRSMFRFTWTVTPGKNTEKDRRQGTRNVREAIRRHRPALYRRYRRFVQNGMADEEELREVRLEFSQIRHRDFAEWSLDAAFNRALTPYFEGSYINAMIMSFPELALDARDFSLKGKWNTPEEARENVRFKLSRYRPALYKRYVAYRESADSSLLPGLRDEFSAIRYSEVVSWRGLGTALNKTECPFFNGSHATMLMESFPELGLTREMFRREPHAAGAEDAADRINVIVNGKRDTVPVEGTVTVEELLARLPDGERTIRSLKKAQKERPRETEIFVDGNDYGLSSPVSLESGDVVVIFPEDDVPFDEERGKSGSSTLRAVAWPLAIVAIVAMPGLLSRIAPWAMIVPGIVLCVASIKRIAAAQKFLRALAAAGTLHFMPGRTVRNMPVIRETKTCKIGEWTLTVYVVSKIPSNKNMAVKDRMFIAPDRKTIIVHVFEEESSHKKVKEILAEEFTRRKRAGWLFLAGGVTLSGVGAVMALAPSSVSPGTALASSGIGAGSMASDNERRARDRKFLAAFKDNGVIEGRMNSTKIALRRRIAPHPDPAIDEKVEQLWESLPGRLRSIDHSFGDELLIEMIGARQAVSTMLKRDLEEVFDPERGILIVQGKEYASFAELAAVHPRYTQEYFVRFIKYCREWLGESDEEGQRLLVSAQKVLEQLDPARQVALAEAAAKHEEKKDRAFIDKVRADRGNSREFAPAFRDGIVALTRKHIRGWSTVLGRNDVFGGDIDNAAWAAFRDYVISTGKEIYGKDFEMTPENAVHVEALLEEALNIHVSGDGTVAPPGSIRSVFEYLCEQDSNQPLSLQEIADGLEKKFALEDLSPESIKDDVRGLLLHLGLIESTTGNAGRGARYFVPERVRNKADRIAPLLPHFTGEELRPKVAHLKEFYREKIEPMLNSKARELVARGEVSLTSDDGEIFTFRYRTISTPDYPEAGYFRIEVVSKGKSVGFIDVLGNGIENSFDSYRDGVPQAAIRVNPPYKRRYRIGTTLMAFAMSISRMNNNEKFFVYNPVIAAEDFFKGLGFRSTNDPGEPRKLIFELNDHPLPTVGVEVKRDAFPRYGPSAGSIKSVFEFLCEQNSDQRLSLKEIADGLKEKFELDDLSPESIKDDVRGLLLHLGLIESTTGRTGKAARYFVRKEIRDISGDIAPRLSYFTGEQLRPKAAVLGRFYRDVLEPVLSPRTEAPQTRRPYVLYPVQDTASHSSTLYDPHATYSWMPEEIEAELRDELDKKFIDILCILALEEGIARTGDIAEKCAIFYRAMKEAWKEESWAEELKCCCEAAVAASRLFDRDRFTVVIKHIENDDLFSHYYMDILDNESGILWRFDPTVEQFLADSTLAKSAAEALERTNEYWQGASSGRDKERSAEWHRRKVRHPIDVEKVRNKLTEIRSMRTYINYHLDDWQRLEEEDFSPQVIEQYADAVEIFNEVILMNESMTADRLEEEYLRFHARLGRKGLVNSHGSYAGDLAKNARIVDRLFTDLFSERFNQKVKSDPLSVASHVFVELVNLQPFNDGNKRAASFILNYILMKSGYEPFVLTEDNVVRYMQIVRSAEDVEDINKGEFREFLEGEVRIIETAPAYASPKPTMVEPATDEPTAEETEEAGNEPVLEIELPSSWTRANFDLISKKINRFVINVRLLLTERQSINIEDVLNELAANIMEHGNGGRIAVYPEKGETGRLNGLRVVGMDNGNGLPRGLNTLVEGSINRDENSDRGQGFARIALDPDRVTVEDNGRTWNRICKDREAFCWFAEGGPSETTSGTKFTLDFDLQTEARKEKAKARMIREREKKMAGDFVDALIYRIEMQAIEAKKRGEKIIIGINTSWIPDDPGQVAAIQGLLNRLSYLSRKKGLDNIIIRRRKDGAALARILVEEKDRTGTPLSNIIVLGDQAVISRAAFEPLKGTQQEAGAFFAGVELPEDFPPNGYIRLVEMLTMAVNLAFGEKVAQADHPYIKFQKIGDRSYIFIPKAKAYDYEVLQELYRLQRNEIDTRA